LTWIRTCLASDYFRVERMAEYLAWWEILKDEIAGGQLPSRSVVLELAGHATGTEHSYDPRAIDGGDIGTPVLVPVEPGP
jgi:hypothetical protein